MQRICGVELRGSTHGSIIYLGPARSIVAGEIYTKTVVLYLKLLLLEKAIVSDQITCETLGIRRTNESNWPILMMAIHIRSLQQPLVPEAAVFDALAAAMISCRQHLETPPKRPRYTHSHTTCHPSLERSTLHWKRDRSISTDRYE